MRFQIARTRQLYQEARPGVRLLDREGRLAILAASDFYQGILDDVEKNDYDVFNRRAGLSGWGKMKRIPSLWWKFRSL
jgi:phytoene synthase